MRHRIVESRTDFTPIGGSVCVIYFLQRRIFGIWFKCRGYHFGGKNWTSSLEKAKAEIHKRQTKIITKKKIIPYRNPNTKPVRSK